jgi:HEPN domain-containing protein
MNSEFLNLIVPVLSVYFALLSIVFAFYLLRRERIRSESEFSSEAARWLENASTLKTLGWEGPAIISAFNALEQALRGTANRKMIAKEENIPLRNLLKLLEDENVLSLDDIKKINKIIEIRNYIVHGQIEKVENREITFAYESIVEIAEGLILEKTTPNPASS